MVLPATEHKLDLSKLYPAYFRAGRAPAIISFGPLPYLAIEGSGAPDSERFQSAVGSLYGIAYTVKMSGKKAGRDFKVSAMEGLWWTDTETGELPNPADVLTMPRERWRWKLLMLVPDFVSAGDIDTAADQLIRKRGDAVVRQVRLEAIDEGQCVQALHLGPYATESETVARMCDFMAANGLKASGHHHEIYLGDPRRTAPEKLRTILRQPVAPADRAG